MIACIGGKAAREGTRFSHSGAIIEGGMATMVRQRETYRSNQSSIGSVGVQTLKERCEAVCFIGVIGAIAG